MFWVLCYFVWCALGAIALGEGERADNVSLVCMWIFSVGVCLTAFPLMIAKIIGIDDVWCLLARTRLTKKKPPKENKGRKGKGRKWDGNKIKTKKGKTEGKKNRNLSSDALSGDRRKEEILTSLYSGKSGCPNALDGVGNRVNWPRGQLDCSLLRWVSDKGVLVNPLDVIVLIFPKRR